MKISVWIVVGVSSTSIGHRRCHDYCLFVPVTTLGNFAVASSDGVGLTLHGLCYNAFPSQHLVDNRRHTGVAYFS